MCIIVTKEKGAKPLPKEIFENCWDNNPNGAGILYNDGKCTILLKGLMKKADFLEKIKEANRKECSFVIHTRIATHGSVKPENTHPFVSKTLGFAHNGTMNITPGKDMTDSETFFLNTIADKTMDWCKKNKFLLDLATKGNRCVIFDMVTGEMLHLCENDWEEDEKYKNVMFSNKSYTYKRSQLFNTGGYYSGKSYNTYDWDDIDYDYGYGAYNKKELDNIIKEEQEFMKDINFVGITKAKSGVYCDWKTVCEYVPMNGKVTFASKEGMLAQEELKSWRELREDAEEYYPTDYTYKTAIRIITSFYGIAINRGYFDNKKRDKALIEFLQASMPWTEKEKEVFDEICYQIGVTAKKGDKVEI